MPDMVEVVIDSVRVSLMSPQRVVVLRQTSSERYLPIWVGPFEAESITVALQEVEMSRPLTHDLMKNLFGYFEAKVVRVEIINLKEDIFYGNIVAEVNRKEVDIDSRPSDAIALAIRAHVPILVSQDVMDNAGVVPERDIQNEAPSAAAASSGEKKPLVPPPSTEGDQNLDIFEDFLKKLKDDPGDEEKPKS